MAIAEFKNAPDLGGWAIATGAGVAAFGVLVVVGEFGLMPAAFIAAVILLVVGSILGLPRSPLPMPGQVSVVTPPAPVPGASGRPQRSSVTPMGGDAKLTPTAAPSGGLGAQEPVAIVAAAAPGSAFVAVVPGAAGGPSRLSSPRNGVSDDLKEIEGIGPALETLLNEMGFYHYDQIAEWSEADVIWVDDNMPRFKGRVLRDRWVPQARLIVVEGLEAFRARAGTRDY